MQTYSDAVFALGDRWPSDRFGVEAASEEVG